MSFNGDLHTKRIADVCATSEGVEHAAPTIVIHFLQRRETSKEPHVCCLAFSSRMQLSNHFCHHGFVLFDSSQREVVLDTAEWATNSIAVRGASRRVPGTWQS